LVISAISTGISSFTYYFAKYYVFLLPLQTIRILIISILLLPFRRILYLTAAVSAAILLPPYFYRRYIPTAAKIPTLSSNKFIQYLETLLSGFLGQINPGDLIHAYQQTRTWCDRLERIAKARTNPTLVQQF
jgi:hypothetical protein